MDSPTRVFILSDNRLFREALSHKGFLGIGAKETVRFSSHESSFQELAATERIYRKVGL